MPAVVSIDSGLRAEFAVLSIAPPGAAEIPFGILLLAAGALDWKLREDIEELALSPEDVEYLSFFESDLRARSAERAAAELFAELEDSLSGFIRISDRERVAGRGVPELLDRLFAKHVDTRVRPFTTHLPYYGLRAAATKFGEDLEVSPSEVEWLRAPRGLRLSPDLFVVKVVGRSMEPLIPDGSLGVFRRFGAGSRQGKRLLIEELGATDSSARFTVKRYSSHKRPSEDGGWEHASIRLEPLNPDFEGFELDAEAFENRYRVLGEFVQVLERDSE